MCISEVKIPPNDPEVDRRLDTFIDSELLKSQRKRKNQKRNIRIMDEAKTELLLNNAKDGRQTDVFIDSQLKN